MNELNRLSFWILAVAAPDRLIKWRFFDLEARLHGQDIGPDRGQITPPEGPGLVRDPDPDMLDRYRDS